MHYLIGLITAMAGLVWAVHRLQSSGFRIASFADSINPFLWHRRWTYSKKVNTKPLHSLTDPMDVAAVLLMGTAKCEGVITPEQKQHIQDVFENNFHLSQKDASDLMVATAHLLRDEIYIGDEVNKILERSGPTFSGEQVKSVVSLMSQVAGIDGAHNHEQTELINKTKSFFNKLQTNSQNWS
ncbi:MAG: TerB family tellurite resistance protein [Gammaproteobacteria bacterium]|nr:TerB family tellurite resistance protein [Gammaproteobacteria bacterium]